MGERSCLSGSGTAIRISGGMNASGRVPPLANRMFRSDLADLITSRAFEGLNTGANSCWFGPPSESRAETHNTDEAKMRHKCEDQFRCVLVLTIYKCTCRNRDARSYLFIRRIAEREITQFFSSYGSSAKNPLTLPALATRSL